MKINASVVTPGSAADGDGIWGRWTDGRGLDVDLTRARTSPALNPRVEGWKAGRGSRGFETGDGWAGVGRQRGEVSVSRALKVWKEAWKVCR
jgi:hypothetical protein